MKHCLKCKKVIPSDSIRDYCPICYEVYEKLFNKIRDYLEKHPMATSFEVSEYTGINHKIIKDFITEGRLIEIESQNQGVNVYCKRCKKLILSKYHKYCPSCEREVSKELNDVKGYFINKDMQAKMHYIKYAKKK